MMGETVVVFTRYVVGYDDCNEPIYEWDSEKVENVLVRPLTADEGDNLRNLRPDGIAVKYKLAFPKTFDKNLAYARIALIDRGMNESDSSAALRVSGNPDYLKPCPTLWNRLAEVGFIDG